MIDCKLDISKMTNEERELYKIYRDSLKELRKKEIDENLKEIESRWADYKEGKTAAARVFSIIHNTKVLLEDLEEIDEDLEEINDCDREEAGEFVF